MLSYTEQVKELAGNIDEAFWQHPEGMEVPFDHLRFLYIPDHVLAFITAQMARQVYRHQVENISTKRQIAKGVIVTMGGMLPGVFLHDHLAWRLNKNILTIEFGTLGVKYYAGPGQPLDAPQVVQEVTVDVEGQVTGIVEDLIDLGGTARFVSAYLKERGATESILIAPFVKSRDVMDEIQTIYYSIVPKDTWIITPRERVETLIKRVPFWRDQGASLHDCQEGLLKIGYPTYLLDIYLRAAYERG